MRIALVVLSLLAVSCGERALFAGEDHDEPDTIPADAGLVEDAVWPEDVAPTPVPDYWIEHGRDLDVGESVIIWAHCGGEIVTGTCDVVGPVLVTVSATGDGESWCCAGRNVGTGTARITARAGCFNP